MDRTLASHGEGKYASHKEPRVGDFVLSQGLGVPRRRVLVFARRSDQESGYSGGRMGSRCLDHCAGSGVTETDSQGGSGGFSI